MEFKINHLYYLLTDYRNDLTRVMHRHVEMIGVFMLDTPHTSFPWLHFYKFEHLASTLPIQIGNKGFKMQDLVLSLYSDHLHEVKEISRMDLPLYFHLPNRTETFDKHLTNNDIYLWGNHATVS